MFCCAYLTFRLSFQVSLLSLFSFYSLFPFIPKIAFIELVWFSGMAQLYSWIKKTLFWIVFFFFCLCLGRFGKLFSCLSDTARALRVFFVNSNFIFGNQNLFSFKYHRMLLELLLRYRISSRLMQYYS